MARGAVTVPLFETMNAKNYHSPKIQVNHSPRFGWWISLWTYSQNAEAAALVQVNVTQFSLESTILDAIELFQFAGHEPRVEFTAYD